MTDPRRGTAAPAGARHVFISYRHDDAHVVDQLVNALGAAYPTWRDTAHIRGGQSWREAIVRAIDAAYAVILVVSPGTEHSKEVYAEYFYARARGVPVIPVRVRECALPFGLDNVHARTWHRDPDQTSQEIKGDLDAYREQAGAAAPQDDVATYLNSLQLSFLLNVASYTAMAGTVHRRARRAARHAPQPVVMQPTFALRRYSPLRDDHEAIEETHEHPDELLPALHSLRQVLLLGEPGIGKTTTLYKFADDLRQNLKPQEDAPINGEEPIPVVVPLREWRGDQCWKDFVSAHLGALADRYDQLMQERRLYLLLDGLNEIPRDAHRADKIEALRDLLKQKVPALVTCRELDYRDEALRLDLDSISIHPLAPDRIMDFLRRYLTGDESEQMDAKKAETLFWDIAGGAEVHALWKKWHAAGASINLFFQAPEIPRESPAVYSETTGAEDQLWLDRVKSPAGLIHLATNPYLLWMMLNIYLALGRIPENRGGLFDEFVFQLFKREGLTSGEGPSAEGTALIERLSTLAWTLQKQAGEAEAFGEGVELTLPRDQAVAVLEGEDRLYRAASANLLEDAEPVRFTHQLLQEYFSARRLLDEIEGGLNADALWPAGRWWQPSGWEEAAVLAAGMRREAGKAVVDWLSPCNPEVAARCLLRSGVDFDDRTKLRLREHWLPVLDDLSRYPEEAARAAIGRALGIVALASGEPLDNRPGVGLTAEGLPDIAWVPIPGGRVVLEDGAGERDVAAFQLARYPVTHAQFRVFLEAADGYRNDAWWQDIVQIEPEMPRWTEANAPRERVCWYEAVAFCRWLSTRLRREIRLPTEFEWQQAATGGVAERTYPWGEWETGRCNTATSGLGRITAVGLYPHGTWPGGPMDMAGNVWEWCLNKAEEPGVIAPDTSGDMRVLRGGSWIRNPGGARSAARGGDRPDGRGGGMGFRVLCASPIEDH